MRCFSKHVSIASLIVLAHTPYVKNFNSGNRSCGKLFFLYLFLLMFISIFKDMYFRKKTRLETAKLKFLYAF